MRLRQMTACRLNVRFERIYGMVKMSSASSYSAARYRESVRSNTINFAEVAHEYDNYDPW